MTGMKTPSAPVLAPPGAGIPTIERLVGGAVFALRRWRGRREKFAAQFERERREIARLYTAAGPDRLARRVLIPRLRGLEDSSRNWSVLMTLDHLRIVNTQIAGVIADLAADRPHPRKASTAAVKPSPEVTAEVISAYEHSCNHLVSTVEGVPNLKSRLRHAHPWFGPLDAAGWHAMAAMHMAIHRAQISTILELGADAP